MKIIKILSMISFSIPKKILDENIDNFGAKAENVLFLHLYKNKNDIGYFAANSKEVDFVIKKGNELIPIESKYIDNLKLRGIEFFIKKYSPSAAYVITKSVENIEKIKNTKVFFIPLYKVLLEDIDFFQLK